VSLALPREWFGSSIRNDGLKRETARLRAGGAVRYLLVAAMPAAALLFYILQGVQVIRTGYEIDELRQVLQALQAEQDQLDVELASLETLESLETLARRDLGMVQPLPEQVVTVHSPAREGTAETAGPQGNETAPPRGSGLLAFLRSITKAL
jgi:cell division protein FtsB